MHKDNPRTLAKDSCRSSARTREAPAALLLAPGASRSAAWKHRNSHTVDVPGSTSSCGTYPAAERTCCHVAYQALCTQGDTTQSPAPMGWSSHPENTADGLKVVC
jgi:hypothetical protein